MKDSKLINILRTFSKEEMKSFEKFTASPYFNSVKNYSALFSELKKFYPGFDDDKLSPEIIYKKLFHNKPFNRQVMWNLTSGFEKLVQEFLIQSSLNNSPRNRYQFLLFELANRDLDKHLLKEMEETGKFLDKYEIDVTHFYHLWVFEESKISYWQKVKGLQNAFAGSMFKASELLVLDFLSRAFRQIANLDVYRSTYNISTENTIFPDFIKNINFDKITEECRRSNSEYSGLIEFYCNIILCVTQAENKENFFKVKDFFFAKEKIFEINEKRNILNVMLNYCLYETRLGNMDYRLILFELNEFSLNEGIAVYENGRINKTLYTQVITNALILNKTEWVINFIKEYTPKLIKEQQKSMRALADGFVDFKLGKYNKVLENLNKVVFIDYRDKIHVRNLTARTYYELKEFNTLLNHIDSSKHFLKNNENLSPFYKDFYGNFYSYLYKIVIASENKDNAGLNSLHNTIKSEKTVSHRLWLLEKTYELLS